MLAIAIRCTLIVAVVGVAAASAPANAQDAIADPPLPAVTIEHFLPVHTDAMRPGPLQAQKRSTGVSRPFFLVGCDAYSLEWLAKNRERLVDLQAFGLVVEAPDARAFRQLEAAAKGLVLRPVSANLIAEHLGLEIYPALITSEGIFP